MSSNSKKVKALGVVLRAWEQYPLSRPTFDFVDLDLKDVKRYADANWDKKWYDIVPCTITYTLPAKKKIK